eukprot:Hpha_TRINITY_DN16121_c2_g2::TRINITY_DN16121_c2_g2_i2::g.4221::m.4221
MSSDNGGGQKKVDLKTGEGGHKGPRNVHKVTGGLEGGGHAWSPTDSGAPQKTEARVAELRSSAMTEGALLPSVRGLPSDRAGVPSTEEKVEEEGVVPRRVRERAAAFLCNSATKEVRIDTLASA